jgi:two-component system cell cycle sensor histidine kinase/response regulator CckA
MTARYKQTDLISAASLERPGRSVTAEHEVQSTATRSLEELELLGEGDLRVAPSWRICRSERSPLLASGVPDRAKSETPQNTILDASPDAIITVDTGGQVLSFNTAACKILGWSADDPSEKRWRDFIPDSNPKETRDGSPARTDGTVELSGIESGRRTDLIARRADGTSFPAEITVSPIQISSDRGYVIWLRDTTEQQHLKNQLWRSQKMEAIGRLAGGIAHDFNNLLTVITGYSDLVLASLGDADPRRKNVEEILKAGERAASLTRQLLAFSRRQVLAPQCLDLNSVVANLDKMLRRLIGEDIEVMNTLTPELWKVKADPGQIEQVLVNLAVNARDAMPGGGQLRIETANTTITAQTARDYDPPMPSGDYVMLTVSDTGCGMDQETLSHIFEPFFTTKEEGKGTGLGLATVYGIVKQSGGFIWAHSQRDHGASFKIYLPCFQEEKTAQETQTASKAPLRARGTETILLVEDEYAVRELARGILEAAGYAVLEARSGEEAIRIFSSRQQPIDFLLTDVVMPQMGGRELAQAVKKMDAKIKIAFMSGYAENAIVHRGIPEPSTVLLQKPFTPAVLVRTIRDTLDEGRKPETGNQQLETRTAPFLSPLRRVVQRSPAQC